MNQGVNLEEFQMAIDALETKVTYLEMKIDEIEARQIDKNDLPFTLPHSDSKNGREIGNRMIDAFLNEE